MDLSAHVPHADRCTLDEIELATRALFIAGKEVEPLNRAAVWAALLGRLPQEEDARDSAAIQATELTLPNQRTVHVDAERTRQDLPLFRIPGAVHRVECILTTYCQRTGSRYKQGLNEILAIPMQLEDAAGNALSDGASLNLLTRFVERFAPRFFASDDVDFISLQCSFRLFRLLTLYHDPAIACVLDQYELPPELYAAPWFLTLFARSHNDTGVVFALWDFMVSCIRSPGPVIFHFVALAFLRSHRAVIVDTARENSGVAELPMKLSRLTFASVEHVRAVCAAALDLFAATPRSFRVLLHNVCYSGPRSSSNSSAPPLAISPSLLLRFENRICIKISVDEVMTGAGSRLTRSASGDGPAPPPACTDAAGFERLISDDLLTASPRYFLIDCRSRDEFEWGGHLPTAFHFDPALFEDPELLDERMLAFADLKGVHLAIMGPGNLSKWYHAPALPAAEQRDRLPGPRDDDTVAVQAGLSPLNADEEDDYGGVDDVTRKVALCFLQRDFRYVSEVEGGFTALHQRRAHFLEAELVSHAPPLCMVCSGGRAQKEYATLKAADSADRAGNAVATSIKRSTPLSLQHKGVRSTPATAASAAGNRAVAGSADASAHASKLSLRSHASEAQRWLNSIVAIPESSPQPAVRVSNVAELAANAVQPPKAQDSSLTLQSMTLSSPGYEAGHGARSRGLSARKRPGSRYVSGVGSVSSASEAALLDAQCDVLERVAEDASGQAVIPEPMLLRSAERLRWRDEMRQRRAFARRASRSPSPPNDVYIEDVLYGAATATAKRAAHVLQRFMSPPAAFDAADAGAALNAQAGGAGGDEIPTLSFAEFMSASGNRSTGDSDHGTLAATATTGSDLVSNAEAGHSTTFPSAAPVAAPPSALPAAPPPLPPARQRKSSIAKSIVASAAAAVFTPPAPSATANPGSCGGNVTLPAPTTAAAGISLPSATQRSLNRAGGSDGSSSASAVDGAGAQHTAAVPLGRAASTVSISPANSRYLDTIRRAALAGLASMGPPRK